MRDDDDDTNPILNEIAAGIIGRGGIVDVYRTGRGVLGSFKSITPARAGWKWDPVTKVQLPQDIVDGFFCVNHSRGVEMLIRSEYHRLEVRKIQPNVFHVIIPA
jgi:hypothetical protein